MILKTSRSNLSSNDQLSLDLPFAATKSLTARVGPTPTFTRGSGATYIGSDGLIHGIDTSTTSNSISAASKTFTLAATAGQDQLWRAGDAVEASNGSNIMTGTVTSYNATTQSLVCNMTTASGTGTFTSWRIGYRGPRFDHNPVSRTNLLLRSNELNISPWGPATVTVEAVAGSGLDGGNAWRLTPTGSDSALGQARTIAASSPHTFSVWLKSDTGSNVSLSLSAWDNTAGQNKGLKSITVTTQWQRFDITTSILVAGNSTSFNIGTFASWTTGENILAWGAQVEAGSFPTSYIPTTTAPVTIRDCRGLLIEEGRTNLFSSTNFNDWSTARVTKTAITGIGLTNQATTLTISETGSTYISRGATLTTSVAYAISVRVKAGTVASFSFADLIDGKYSRGFNLSTNQWAASGGAAEFTNYTVTPNIDGWFLVSAIYTPTGATGLKTIAFLLNTPVVGQTVSFDTPQIEAGSFPTSYIPTTTGTLARGADVCNITGGNFNNFYNQSEGTLFADVSGLMNTTLSGNRAFVAISDGTYNNFFGILKAAGIAAIRGEGVTGGGANQFTLSNLYDPSTQYKVALGVKTNDTNAAFNGSLKTTDTSVTLPSTMNRLEFRDATGAVGGQPSCHLAAIRYYKKRLPNAKLAQLTA